MADRQHLRSVRKPKPVKADPDVYSFVGAPRSLSGEPGERIGVCTDADVFKRGTKVQVKLSLCIDGERGFHWIDLPEKLTDKSKYSSAVAVALGRPAREGEPIGPAAVFVGKRFRVSVGWRKSQKQADGRVRQHDDLAKVGPKDASDFLRVHDLLERLGPT